MTRLFPLLVLAAFLRTAPAAVVTVTDCVADPHLSTVSASTHLDVGSDDLVLACALAPLPGTDHVIVDGHDVTIQGPAGSITGNSTQANKITATGTFTAAGATIEQTNGNGGVLVSATGDVSITNSNVTTGNVQSGGDLMLIECTGGSPKCTVTIADSNLTGRHIRVEGVGNVTLSKTKVVTQSPTDLIRITSFMGDVNLGAGPSSGQGDCCGFGGGGGNTFVSGNEGNLFVRAFGKIDAAGANVLVAELICLRSGVSSFGNEGACDACDPNAPSSQAAGVPATIDVTDASLRNDFAKPGEIELCADETRSTITLTGATLVDDNTSQLNDVSELNGCEQVPRTTPPCVNLVGTPATDS
ncbi:MAG TPA: hypothetical protein VFD84_16975 [Candidatus Binatia bacterium]|jgi:hypothetical protein|nr:hypothetical protein [Candidatus Binatia bacterium]